MTSLGMLDGKWPARWESRVQCSSLCIPSSAGNLGSHLWLCWCVGMSVRGQYYPNNKEIPAGERKLFLQIESLTKRGLQLAIAEVARLIKEEMMKMVSFDVFILSIKRRAFFWILFSKIQHYNWSIVVVTKCCSLQMEMNMCLSFRRRLGFFVESNFVSLISFHSSLSFVRILPSGHWKKEMNEGTRSKNYRDPCRPARWITGE